LAVGAGAAVLGVAVGSLAVVGAGAVVVLDSAAEGATATGSAFFDEALLAIPMTTNTPIIAATIHGHFFFFWGGGGGGPQPPLLGGPQFCCCGGP
jgi:hypothetical protein